VTFPHVRTSGKSRNRRDVVFSQFVVSSVRLHRSSSVFPFIRPDGIAIGRKRIAVHPIDFGISLQGVALGFYLPVLWLDQLVRERRTELEKSLREASRLAIE